jgi:hypothetical protein
LFFGCVCNSSSCPAGEWCDFYSCAPCNVDEHCGTDCIDCTLTGEHCINDGTECGPL